MAQIQISLEEIATIARKHLQDPVKRIDARNGELVVAVAKKYIIQFGAAVHIRFNRFEDGKLMFDVNLDILFIQGLANVILKVVRYSIPIDPALRDKLDIRIKGKQLIIDFSGAQQQLAFKITSFQQHGESYHINLQVK